MHILQLDQIQIVVMSEITNMPEEQQKPQVAPVETSQDAENLVQQPQSTTEVDDKPIKPKETPLQQTPSQKEEPAPDSVELTSKEEEIDAKSSAKVIPETRAHDSMDEIAVPASFVNGQEKEVAEVVEAEPMKGPEETVLTPPPELPEMKVLQEAPPMSELDRQARQEAQRLSQFRRKHMIFPPKLQEPEIKRPLGNQVIANTVEVLKNRFHPNLKQSHIKDEGEYKMILKTTVSKKRENYKQLREWEERRGKSLQWYLAVVENFIRGVDSKVKLSFQNVDVYVTFFRERVNQEQKYVINPIIDTTYAFSKNEVSSTVYSDCVSLLGGLAQLGKEKVEKIQNLAYLIKKDILNDTLDKHILKSKTDLVGIKEKMQAVRNAISQAQQVLAIMTVQLPCHLEDHPNKPTQPHNDFYLSQLTFLRKANEFTNLHQKLAELGLCYYEAAKQMEAERVEAIKNVLTLYMIGMKEAYGVEVSEDMEKKLSRDESGLIEGIYAPVGLVDPKLQEQVKIALGVDIGGPVNMQQLVNYFQNLHFEPFDCRMLVLKEYRTVNYHKDSANETCTLVITVDRYLHIFLNTELAQSYSKPSRSFKIDGNLSVKRTNEMVQILKVIQKKGVISYLIWEPPTEAKFVIQFVKKDNASEFQDYINTLI